MTETLEAHRKSFFAIYDELKDEEDDETSVKMKRDIIVEKLMIDRRVIVDRYLASGYTDKILSSLFTALSRESRKILIENSNDDYNIFHSIIGFDKEQVSKNMQISNDLIINLCNKFVKLNDRIIILI
jgi:hypothetical protein